MSAEAPPTARRPLASPRVSAFWLNMPVRALALVEEFARRTVVCTCRGQEVLIVDVFDAGRSAALPAWTLPCTAPPRGAFHLRKDIYVVVCLGWLLLYRLGDGAIVRTIRIHTGAVHHISKLDADTIVTVSGEGIHLHRCPESLPRDAPTLARTVALEGIRQLWLVDRSTALVACRTTPYRDRLALVDLGGEACGAEPRHTPVRFFAEGSPHYRHCRIGRSMVLVGQDSSFDVYDFSREPPRKVHTEPHNNRNVDVVDAVRGEWTSRGRCLSVAARSARLWLPGFGMFAVSTRGDGSRGELLSIERMGDIPELKPTQDLILLGPEVLVAGGRGFGDGLYRYDRRADGTWGGAVEIAAGEPSAHFNVHNCSVDNVPDAALEAVVAEIHAAKEERFGSVGLRVGRQARGKRQLL